MKRQRKHPISGGRITRLDPSRTLTLRKQFQTDLRRRFVKLRKAIIELIVTEDALGLKQRKQLVFHAQDEPGKWITVKGNHIFIPEGVDKGEAIKKHFTELNKKSSKSKQTTHKQLRSSYEEQLNLVGPEDSVEQKEIRSKIKTVIADLNEHYRLVGLVGEDIPPMSEEVYGGVEYAHNKYKAVFEGSGLSEALYIRFDAKDGTRQQVRYARHDPVYKASRIGPTVDSGKLIKATVDKLYLRPKKTAIPGSEESLVKARDLPSFDADKLRMQEAKKRGNTLNRLQANVDGRWLFHSTEQKLTAFQQWLKQRIAMYLIRDQIDENDWWNRYIMEGFKKGTARAFDDTRPQVRAAMQKDQQAVSDFYAGTKDEFLRSSFNWPVSREKVKLLASRTFTDLKGVTDGMAARISHDLVDGLTKGDSPRVIARQLSKDVNFSRSRAESVARTEIIRTHAEGQLDAFEKLGVTEVGVMAEWSTAEDERVCELCRPLDGLVMKTQEARGLLPRHPNCRCAWTPANVGEDEKEQKRSKTAIERAIDRSYRAELPQTSKRTLAEQKKLSRWGGADKVISKKRPTSIFG